MCIMCSFMHMHTCYSFANGRYPLPGIIVHPDNCLSRPPPLSYAQMTNFPILPPDFPSPPAAF